MHISTSNFESSPLCSEWGMSPLGSCAWSIVLSQWLCSGDGPLMEGIHQQGWALRSQSLAYFPLSLLLTTDVTCPRSCCRAFPSTWSVYPLGLQAKASPVYCKLLLLALYHNRNETTTESGECFYIKYTSTNHTIGNPPPKNKIKRPIKGWWQQHPTVKSK